MRKREIDCPAYPECGKTFQQLLNRSIEINEKLFAAVEAFQALCDGLREHGPPPSPVAHQFKKFEKSVTKLRSLAETPDTFVVEGDRLYNVTYASPSFLAFLGAKKNEVIGKNAFSAGIAEKFYAFPQSKLKSFLRRLSMANPIETCDFEFYRRGNRDDKVWVRFTIKILVENGKMIGYRAMGFDATEQKLVFCQLTRKND